MLRSGNVHSAERWRQVLEPIVERYRQPGEKDGDSMTSFVMESFANVDGRGFQEQRYTVRSWRRLLQGPVVEIDNKGTMGILFATKQ